jgi:hypothetical protein
MILFVALPLWILLCFLGYLLGRKQFSLRVLLLFVTAEATSLAFFPTAVIASVPSEPSYVFTPNDYLFLTAIATLVTMPVGGIAVISASVVGYRLRKSAP